MMVDNKAQLRLDIDPEWLKRKIGKVLDLGFGELEVDIPVKWEDFTDILDGNITTPVAREASEVGNDG